MVKPSKRRTLPVVISVIVCSSIAAVPLVGQENLDTAQAEATWQAIAPYFRPPETYHHETGLASVGELAPVLRSDDGSPITTAKQWGKRRERLLEDWHQMLGPWPEIIEEPEVEVLGSQRREDFQQLRVRFRWTPDQWTTGYLLIPPGPGPFPAVLTVFYEPETAIGAAGSKPYRDYALQLARRGFVTLSIGTSEATENKTYSIYYPSIENAQVQPLSMLAYAAVNAWHVLASRPEVDSERIGIVGHSFGGKWAMFASCLSEKFACAVWSDPGILFQNDRSSINYWEPWYLGYHPKPWRKRGLITEENPARGLYPKLIRNGRNLHELHALMAPRPFLVSGGSEDPVERWAALNHSIAVNRILGYEDRVAMTNRPEHAPTAESNAVVYAFFEHFLRPAKRFD